MPPEGPLAVTPTPADQIERLAVVGAGTLGWQIACLAMTVAGLAGSIAVSLRREQRRRRNAVAETATGTR